MMQRVGIFYVARLKKLCDELNIGMGEIMDRKAYLEFHRAMCDRMIDITRVKNEDYSTSEDPFANFRSCELMNVASTMQGFLTRMLDKISRINSFAQRGQLSVKDESVQDTLLDLANYSILMAGFIKSETGKDMSWGDPEVVIDYGKPPAPSAFSQRIESKL